MSSFLKKSFLTAVLGSAALLAGCSHDNRPKGPPRHTYTRAELMTKATAAAQALGEKIHSGDGDSCNTADPDDTSDKFQGSCRFHVEKIVDDGLMREASYEAASNDLSLGSCELRENDGVADRDMRDIVAAFHASAKQKFARMQFTILDTFQDAQSYLNQGTDDCYGHTTASFLLKSGVTGKLYSATFTEDYVFADKAGTEGAVSDLVAIDRPAKAPQKIADDDESASSDPASAPEETSQTPKAPESKLCVGICAGPHIDLKTGQLKVFGTGPGYKLP